MSFLQKNLISNSFITNQYMPSPTYTQNDFMYKSRANIFVSSKLAGRMSPFTSFPGKRHLEGSMTVEASLLLPLFMFFFLHLMGYVEMLRLHGNMCFALWNTGNQLSVYAAVPGEDWIEVPDTVVSYLYVANSVKQLLGEEYLDTSPLVHGAKGLNFLSADYQRDCIDIGVTYQVSPQVTIFPFPYMRLVNRYYGKAWTGYDVAEKELRYVYVTVYGEVWHETASCSYIFLTVRKAPRDEISRLRNEKGESYTLCKRCKEVQVDGYVYYTEQGSSYHRDKKCASLNRYIRAIEWQEDLAYRPCSRCAQGDR